MGRTLPSIHLFYFASFLSCGSSTLEKTVSVNFLQPFNTTQGALALCDMGGGAGLRLCRKFHKPQIIKSIMTHLMRRNVKIHLRILARTDENMSGGSGLRFLFQSCHDDKRSAAQLLRCRMCPASTLDFRNTGNPLLDFFYCRNIADGRVTCGIQTMWLTKFYGPWLPLSSMCSGTLATQFLRVPGGLMFHFLKTLHVRSFALFNMATPPLPSFTGAVRGRVRKESQT